MEVNVTSAILIFDTMQETECKHQRGRQRETHQSDCGPSGGLGQTLGLNAALSSNTSYAGQHRGSALQFGATTGTTKNDEK